MVWRICCVAFELGLGRKGFFCVCVLVDVHEMGKIRKQTFYGSFANFSDCRSLSLLK